MDDIETAETEGAAPCACGSGLAACRCCLAKFGMAPSEAATRHLTPLAEAAEKAHEDGDIVEATRLCLEILELAPGHAGALVLLYRIRKIGAPRAAETLLRRLARIYPAHAWTANELTALLLDKAAWAEAESAARHGLRIAPHDVRAHHLMALVMTRTGRTGIGEHHYRWALTLAGRREPALLADAAANLEAQERRLEARSLYEEALAADAGLVPALLGLARLEAAEGHAARAQASLDAARALAPGDGEVELARAALGLDADARHGGWEKAPGSRGLLEWGRLLDRQGRHDEAFAAIEAGRRLEREADGAAGSKDEAQAQAQALKAFFVGARLKITPRAETLEDAPQPIFVVGFPGSGVAMAGRALGRHAAIAPGGEAPFIADIARFTPSLLGSPLGYPDALADLVMGDRQGELDNLRDYYLGRARQAGLPAPGARWFVDRTPLNETHLALIALLFPVSPIIHMVRHPLDATLHAFSRSQTPGFSALEAAARRYALVDDLVAHYRGQMPLRYLSARQENLAADPKAGLGRLFDFIGEPFDDRSLALGVSPPGDPYPHRRYLKQLAPVVPILARAMERLDYEAPAVEASR